MANTLTNADIIEAIQKENGYSRKQSAEVIEILLEIIKIGGIGSKTIFKVALPSTLQGLIRLNP